MNTAVTISAAALAKNDRVSIGGEPATIVHAEKSLAWPTLSFVRYRRDGSTHIHHGYYPQTERFRVL